VVEVSEVVPSLNANTLPAVKPIYSFNYAKDKLVRTKNKSSLLRLLAKTNGLSEKQVQKQIQDKEKAIQKTLMKKTSFKEFLKVVKDVN
ncbi:MAG: hypothetical protein GOV15_01210, partial [Candidatus Diapherotrites archaeon]|nr:hypothetical protein [Candidatus Diapherotrites archaeon]